MLGSLFSLLLAIMVIVFVEFLLGLYRNYRRKTVYGEAVLRSKKSEQTSNGHRGPK